MRELCDLPSMVCRRVSSVLCSKRNCQGEVYVLNDGGEVDLDLGNYERYLDVTLSRDNNITTGKIYQQVIEREVRLVGNFHILSCGIKPCTATWRLSRTNGAGELN